MIKNIDFSSKVKLNLFEDCIPGRACCHTAACLTSRSSRGRTSPTSARPWCPSPGVRRSWPRTITTTTTCSAQQTGGNTSTTTGSLIASASDARWSKDSWRMRCWYSNWLRWEPSNPVFLQCQHSVTQCIYSIRGNVKLSSFILLWWQDPTELNTFVNALKCGRCGQPGVLPINPLDLDSDWRVGMSPPGVRSHILTNRTLICQPSGPSLKFSVKSVTIQQTREKLRKFFQEMDQWSTYFFLPQNSNCFLSLFCSGTLNYFLDHWIMTTQPLRPGLTQSPIHILRNWSWYWGRYRRFCMKIIISLLTPRGDSLISTGLRKTFNTPV